MVSKLCFEVLGIKNLIDTLREVQKLLYTRYHMSCPNLATKNHFENIAES